MHTYCRLKDGRIMILWSDNVDEETVTLFELSELDELGNYDAEFLTTEEFAYSEIDKTDTNLAYLRTL